MSGRKINIVIKYSCSETRNWMIQSCIDWLDGFTTNYNPLCQMMLRLTWYGTQAFYANGEKAIYKNYRK